MLSDPDILREHTRKSSRFVPVTTFPFSLSAPNIFATKYPESELLKAVERGDGDKEALEDVEDVPFLCTGENETVEMVEYCENGCLESYKSKESDIGAGRFCIESNS